MFPGSNRCDQQRFDTSTITGSLWKKKSLEGWSWTRAHGASSFLLSGVNYSTNQLPPPPPPPSSDGQPPHDPHSTASPWLFFFFLHLTGFHRTTVWLPGCSLGGVWLLLTGLLSFELIGGRTDKICQSSLFLLVDNSHAWFVLFCYCYHSEFRTSRIPVCFITIAVSIYRPLVGDHDSWAGLIKNKIICVSHIRALHFLYCLL